MGWMVTDGGGRRNGPRRQNGADARIFGAAFHRARVSDIYAVMLTAVLLAYDAPSRPLRGDAVARSLASLVESCVQGLVADAVLVGAPARGLDRIADDAGCALVENPDAGEGLDEALKLARRDEILLLLAGHALERGFIDEVQDLFAYGDHSRPLILRVAPHSLPTRLAPRLATPVGIIARKKLLRDAAPADLKRLAKKLAGADLTTRARLIL